MVWKNQDFFQKFFAPKWGWVALEGTDMLKFEVYIFYLNNNLNIFFLFRPLVGGRVPGTPRRDA